MKRIIVALPTCGKTYACKKMIRETDVSAVDLDVRGAKFFRTPEVVRAQTRYAIEMLNAGCEVIFTHNGFIDFKMLNPSAISVDIVIRDTTPANFGRHAAMRGDSVEFITECVAHYEQWVDGMWHLFDELDRMGFQVRVICLPDKRHIWDYLSEDISLLHCDCKERN